MQGLREIKRRIRSVKNTQQITKAMKMVAASRLRKAQEAVESARPYAHKMREMFLSILEQSGELTHPLFEVRGNDRVLYIVLTAERGLCGAFNTNIMKKALSFEEDRIKAKNEERRRWLELHGQAGEDDAESEEVQRFSAEIPEAMWLPVGRKGRDYLNFRGFKLVGEFLNITEVPITDLAAEIAEKAVQMFEDGEVDEVYVVYSQFITVMQQRPAVFKLLPLVRPEFEKAEEDELESLEGEPQVEYIERWLPPYIFEPDAEMVLSFLIPKYLETIVLHALLETTAGEFGARMTAMDNATKNAGEVIDDLTLQFNQARQSSITQEILEIVGGAEALK
ncbi:MAG: F0F1 ATP synthase subunit gamma [Firmicutes bacterium]|nr:F0F1 ATP synthase subunit gamma [Bacillota bacterium]